MWQLSPGLISGRSAINAAAAGGGGANPVSYIGASRGAPTANVFTYSNAPINTQASDIVVVGHVREGSGSTTTGINCGATSLTLWSPGALQINFLNVSNLELFYGVPGALATANIAATTTGSTTGSSLFVFVVRGCNATPLDQVSEASVSSATITLSNIQTAVGGAVVSIGQCQQASVTMTEAWTGSETVIEDFDSDSATGNSEIVACHFATTTTGTTDDLTYTISASRTHVGAAISFGP